MTENRPSEGSPAVGHAMAETAPDVVVPEEKTTSLWGDAWQTIRSRPMFWLSAVFIVFFIALAIAPQLFTNQDPFAPGFCKLELARESPNPSALFGRDLIGCDVYTLTVYGARSSILVGTLATLATLLLGVPLGIVAGYLGGWVDTVLSRLADMFFAIPLLLGGIIIMYSFKLEPGTPYLFVVAKVVLAIGILGWPNLFRLMRSSVLQVKPNEYVQAARALGASPLRIIVQHVLPNAIAPVIVVATIDTGANIAIEDDGTIYIGAETGESAEAARAAITAIANPTMPEKGERYLGTVVKLTTFGAFVSLLPGKDGLLHISKLRPLAGGNRVEKVEDVLSVGQKLQVEINEIDDKGKLSLIPVIEEDKSED